MPTNEQLEARHLQMMLDCLDMVANVTIQPGLPDEEAVAMIYPDLLQVTAGQVREARQCAAELRALIKEDG